MSHNKKEFFAGRVISYYSAIGVASVLIIDYLETGNHIHIRGHTTDFEQTLESMQMSHQPVTKAAAGDVVGIKVNEYARKNDLIYRVQY